MNVTLLYDRVLVRLLEAERVTKGGLFIPDMATDNTPYLKAEVMAVGHGRLSTTGVVVPLQVQKGDVIVFFRNAASGEQLIWPAPDGDRNEWMIIREPNVAAILRDLKPASLVLDADGRQMEAS